MVEVAIVVIVILTTLGKQVNNVLCNISRILSGVCGLGRVPHQ
ncbi:MAG TPA: hypothetical protein VND88_02665 [Candidatus Acidoferrales bacterium]|nr:hypothetical protein [Candidatus Acidoferrales bacterium]